jgi:hypothetical protein
MTIPPWKQVNRVVQRKKLGRLRSYRSRTSDPMNRFDRP